MLVSCEEHIDHVIDEFLDEYERSPDLLLVEYAAKDMELPVVCHYCGRPPLYLLL